MNGNKIDINEVGNYEITITKCGLFSLVCVVYPNINLLAYEVRTSEEKIFESYVLRDAIQKYNEVAE